MWLKDTKRKQGFTLIEILVAVAILGIMFSVTLPVSYELFQSYKNSLKAQEVLLYLASLKRECFLYSEEKDISSANGALVVNGEEKRFPDVYIEVKEPIKLFKNGTSNGGEVELKIGKEKYKITVKAPFAELSLERVKHSGEGA